MIWKMRQLCDRDMPQVRIGNYWVPARGVNRKFRSFTTRVSEAWAVFTGRAEAFIWPEDDKEEIERLSEVPEVVEVKKKLMDGTWVQCPEGKLAKDGRGWVCGAENGENCSHACKHAKDKDCDENKLSLCPDCSPVQSFGNTSTDRN